MRKVFFALAAALIFGFQPAEAQMKFFVSSTRGPDATGPRGIAAADEHCELLGYGAGYGDFQWRAFLDAPASEGSAAVKASDRVGIGPWYNFEGVLVASNHEELADGGHNLTRQTAVNELGFRPYSGQSAPDPAEVLSSGEPDANGLYFCFAL